MGSNPIPSAMGGSKENTKSELIFLVEEAKRRPKEVSWREFDWAILPVWKA